MNKKRITCVSILFIMIVMVVNPIFIVEAFPNSQNDEESKTIIKETKVSIKETMNVLGVSFDGDKAGGLSNDLFTFLEAPYLSADGTILYNADLPKVLIADPNPEMHNLRFPQNIRVAAAIADPSVAGATISITFKAAGTQDPWGTTCTSFPESGKTSFNAAAALWANLLQSSVPITISACWSNELPTGVLGYSGGGIWRRDFSGAPLPNTWYKSSLANSFAGFDLDPESADMHISYSSAFNWYYGTDGNIPVGQYDLVTVAAHEIAHGLHFSGWMAYSGGLAQFGEGSGYPSVYETFMESGAGIKLTSYTNTSTALGDLTTSNDLWWNGTHANVANGGMRVKMYAPSTWVDGSSYSHLDYDSFAGTINSMMVYSIGSGSSQHNPGPVTEGILQDMGWIIGSSLEDPPPAPSGVSATDGTFTERVQISWEAVEDATHYKVFKNTTDTHNGELELASSHTSNSYDDTNTTPGTTYFYWVKACNSAGCSLDYSSSDSGYAANEVAVPSAPENVLASDGAFTDKVQISWGAVAGATHYKVYRNITDTHSAELELASGHASSPYEDFGAVQDTTYYYWVQACVSEDCSDYSHSDSGYAASVVTSPSAPENVWASDGTFTDRVQITWDAAAGATYYQVFRNTSDTHSGEDELESNHIFRPFEDTSVSPNTTYYYWVKACNSAGCSDYSSSDSGYIASEVKLNPIYLPLILK